MSPGYSLVSPDLWLRNFSSTTLPSGAHVWYKACVGLWCLRQITHRAPLDTSSDSPPDSSPDSSYIIIFLDDPGPIEIDLQHYRYTTARLAISGSWCLPRHGTGSNARGVLKSTDTACGSPITPHPRP